MSVSRRGLMMGAGLAGVAAASPALAAQALQAPALEVLDLKAGSVTAPIGVEDQAVRLSWRLASPDPDVKQTRYEIQAASSREKLEAGDPDLWHAGEVLTDQSMDVSWLGSPLTSRQIVWWRVLVRDNKGRKATSAVASFEIGLLQPADWTAKWIAAETELAKADRQAGLLWMRGDRPADRSARYFRLAFDLPAAANVTLFSIANFTSDVWLDGQPVQRPPHSPIAFGVAPIAETHHKLAAGRHVVAIKVQDPTGFNEPKLHEIAAAVMVRAELPGGKTLRITSRGMKTALQAPDGWMRPGFADGGWAKAEPSKNQPQAWPGYGAFLLRKDFKVARPIARARLYATALGAYEAQINGKRVGDALLTPESTDFRKTALYRVYDVTDLLSVGDNAIGAMVGDGWYGSYHAPAGRYTFGDTPLRFLGQLEITYVDGSRETVASDETWRIAAAPITRGEIYYGEDYDARLEQPGWATAGFTGKGWRAVDIAPTPPCALKAQTSPPIRRIETLKATSIKAVGSRHVFDFGQNFAGWARLKVRGKAGQVVTLRFAEVLGADGHVDQSNLRAARAAVVYTLKGDPAGETYEPRFTYFGFRYVEVEGLAEVLGRAPTAEDVEGIVVSSNLAETGHLRIANPVIQQLWRNSLWSQRSNFVGVPTDCPQRDERLGWTGDANVFWDAAAFNMDVAAFTERFGRDLRDAQGPRGEFPDYAPAGFTDLGLGASPGWADAGVMLPWTVWKRYNDTAIVDQNWAAMTRYLGFIRTSNPDLIWRKERGYDFGDWVALDAKQPGDETTPKALIATAWWKRSVEAMADMAYGSGRKPDAVRYRDLASQITAAFQREFVRPDGSMGNGSQAGYILALRFGLVPEALRATATAHLVADIRRRGNLLSTGFLGTPFSLDALADNDQDGVVYDLLLRTDFPSWGYMIRKGATTIWERWNGDVGDVAMNSFNHYALGAVTGFVFRRIAGIEPIRAGFLSFRFDPVLDARVPKGGGDYDSVLGRISTDWELKADGSFDLHLVAPTNSRAEVHIPAKSAEAVRVNGVPVAQAPGVTVQGLKRGRLVLEIGSGDHRFQARA
ncbi:alpha-L-rhamnosidase [Caulobacter sp. RHG1]|uniref:alpha-L-rhamnosidase n=1 Tax=Caulobacter sp. (strain RHG1) TaxID=2545762 RepID=UPI001F505602|nr:alpha-L-rhamnosidase [Caulobacter sp. RHG1]NQE61268.1 alpha-L-rhamnosidase [Caulobacter sp. RHG1]